METKLFIFLLAISLCNGQIPFGNILSSAHSKIHEVAGGIIDGIAQGLHLNVEGNIDLKTQTSRGPYQSTKPPEETIVVVVEEGADSNEYGRRPGNYRPHHKEQRPPFNNNGHHGHNDYRPHENRPGRPHYHVSENFNNNGNYNNFNQGVPNNYGRPQNYYDNNQYHGNKPNRYPNYPNERYPNYGGPQYPQRPNENNGFNDQNNGNYNNGYNPGPNYGNNYYDRPNRPPQFNNNNQQNNNEKYPNPNYNDANYGNENTDGNQFINNPVTEFSTIEPVSTLKPSQVTKKPDNDIPLFIPLLPTNNDKNVTAPKRETDDNKPKPAEDLEEDFELDVRIKP